jgi:nucleoside-diphosphate-sugar epimerase
MNKVMVTGGGGFIGKALVRELAGRGVETLALGRNPYPELTAMGVRCLQGDIRDPDFLNQALAGCDTVFHVAAKAGIWGPRREYEAINVVGTENVVAACRKNGVARLVHTSTPSVVFAGHNLEGADESAPYASRPLCHYAATKIQAEQAVLRANATGLRTAAIRPHLVWGPGDRNLIPRLLERGRTKALKIVGNGANRVDIAYIDNVTHAHILAAENLEHSGSAAGQAFFIGQQQPVALWPWINDLFVRMGIPPVTGAVPFPLAYAVGGVMEAAYAALGKTEEPRMTRFLAHQLAQSHWFSHDKAKTLLGYCEVVDVETGLNRLVDWLKADGAGPGQ